MYDRSYLSLICLKQKKRIALQCNSWCVVLLTNLGISTGACGCSGAGGGGRGASDAAAAVARPRAAAAPQPPRHAARRRLLLRHRAVRGGGPAGTLGTHAPHRQRYTTRQKGQYKTKIYKFKETRYPSAGLGKPWPRSSLSFFGRRDSILSIHDNL